MGVSRREKKDTGDKEGPRRRLISDDSSEALFPDPCISMCTYTLAYIPTHQHIRPRSTMSRVHREKAYRCRYSRRKRKTRKSKKIHTRSDFHPTIHLRCQHRYCLHPDLNLMRFYSQALCSLHPSISFRVFRLAATPQPTRLPPLSCFSPLLIPRSLVFLANF